MTDPNIEPTFPAEVVGAPVANHREFLAFLERRLGDRALAEDILQDAFVRGLDKLDQLQSDRIRDRLVLQDPSQFGDRSAAPAGYGREEARGVCRREGAASEVHSAVCHCIARLAATLKPEYAEALRRVELDGMSVKEYAAQNGITSGNASVRLSRARDALKKQVARSRGTCAEHGCLDCTCGHCA